MSLKSKIEAVIYASEEPVTLAQLVGLLGEEAQAELDRAGSTQQMLLLDEAAAEAEEATLVAREPVLASNLEPGGPDERTSLSPDAAQPDGPTDEIQDVPDGGAVVPEIRVGLVGAGPQDAAAAAAAGRAEKARLTRLRAYFRAALDGLIADYATEDHGLEIREVAGGFRFATKPEYHDAVRGFVKSLKPPLKLTLQSLETLAVVAYKQPVTSPEISEIRGVDSSGVLGSLIARKLITTAGRKQVIGRPILYKTTKEFLLKFGLKDVAELPSIEEFEKIAGQMAEQEEIAMEHVARPHSAPETADELEEQREAYAPQADGESAPADNVSNQSGDKASVDGRIASLPPNYEDAGDDPSAREAGIQSGE